jgi:hypothetical protein
MKVQARTGHSYTTFEQKGTDTFTENVHTFAARSTFFQRTNLNTIAVYQQVAQELLPAMISLGDQSD